VGELCALLRCSVVCSQGKKTKTKGNYQGNLLLLLLLLLLLQQDFFLVLRFCVEGEVEVEEEGRRRRGGPRAGGRRGSVNSLSPLSLFDGESSAS
jgi:hypothetical protein